MKAVARAVLRSGQVGANEVLQTPKQLIDGGKAENNPRSLLPRSAGGGGKGKCGGAAD